MAISEFTRERARKTREKNIEKTRYDEETGIRLDSGNDEYYKKAWENYKRVKASDLAPKVAGGTVNPIISFGNVRENPVLKRKTNTTKTYSQALTENRNKAKVLENGAKLPTVIPPKGDVSKLILPDTGGGGTVNPTLKRNEVRTNYDYMTDREAAVYKYYRDRGQVEKAQEYLDALEMDVNQRAAMQKREDAKKLAEESTAAALYARAVGNIGQAAGAVYAVAMEGADKPVDPYHPLMGGVNMNEGLYEGLMGQSTGANKVFKDIGLGIFDWGTQAALLGPATPYVMAAGAAAGNTKDALERGGTDALERGGTTDEAVMYGLAGGAAEAITEKLGYDRLFKYGANAIAKKLGYAGLFELSDKIADKGALAKFLWEVMPHGASEGLEEATSEFTNIVADTLVLGDNSQMKQIAQTAMENGATESEAVKTALQQGFLQVIYSGAIGAASGGVIAGGIGGLSRAKGRNALEMAGNPAGVAREAMTNAGKEVTKRINDGGVIAGGIGGLSRAKGRNALEMAGNPAGVAREAMTNAGKEVTKRINDMRSQGKAEVPEGTTQGNVLPEQGNVMGNSENTSMEQRQENKALRDFGEKYYYTEGQKVVNEEAERRGDTSFIPAFQTYYTAGLTGVKESDIKQTAETAVADKMLLNRAYEAGALDRKEDLEMRLQGTGKMTDTPGVVLETEAITEGQKALANLVSETTGALDRKEDLEMRLQGTGKMTDTPGVVLETEAITEGQKALANLVSETTGAEVWVVDRIKEGVRGTFDRNKGRITIALDSGQFAGTLFHESVHFIRDASPEGFDRLRQAVFSTAAAMKGMDLETYVRKYEKMYGEAYQQEGREIDFDQILEEMVADAFAEVAGNEKAMRALVTELKKENPSVLEKLKDFVDSLLKTLKSLVTDGRFSSFGAELQKDIDFTERMAKMLAEEMKTAGEMQRGEKTSIKNRKQVFSDINLEADPKVPGTEVRLSYKNKNDLPLMENITQSKKEDNGKERESENRFSLKEPIEETKDLIAVHNLTGEKLRKLLDLQGIPMPSIAITKSDATAEDFGEISLVFRKDAIDPADERNKVYDADAWTPMFPTLDKEEYRKTRAFLEELVRTMQAQTKSGKNAQGFMGENTMRAAMANRFVSLGEIKEAREKLEHLPKEEFEALREEMNQRLFGVLEKIYNTGSQTGINEVYEMEDIGEQIQNMAEEAKGVPSAQQIQQNLKKAGYPISMELAEQTARVLEEIKEMPTDFFEAKPERVVEFAEVAAAVVPDDLEVDLRKAVENKIPQVLEYEAGSKESRVRKLNRVQGVRFSIRETEDGKKVAVVDNDILSHVDTENWNKTEKEKARKAAVESLLRFQNGIVVDHLKYHVNKQSRDEYTRSNDAERLYRVDKEAYGDKMRLAAYIDDAIVAATNWKADENLKHDRKDKIVQFLHGETLIQSGDNQYVAKVIVGITTAGRYLFYDVEDLKRTKFKLKEESSTAVVGNDTVNAIQEDSSDQSVAQGKREVKDVSQINDMDIYFSIREEDISYDSLIEKADMPVVKLDSHAMDGKKRKDVYPIAKQSVRSRNHPDNTEEKQYVYNADIDRKILVGRGGIEHSLQRKWEETAVMMTKLGEILENAVEINPLKKRDEADEAYVLLGYGEDEQGNGYPAYFVVNIFPDGTNRLEYIDVLYSAKAKKIEPSANPIKNGNAAKARGDSAPSLSGSTISIKDLLEEVNILYSDILPQSVADHFGNTRRKTKLGESVLFSIREEAYDALVEENEALKEANEALRRQLEITKDAVHDPVSAKKAVRKWLKAINSTYDVDIFTEKFVALADYVANAGDRVDFQQVMGALQKLAYDALSESKVLNTDLSDAYKDFKNEVRKTKIKVTDSMLEELEYYGGYIEFRKRNFGKLNLSRQSGIPADVFYQEMAEKYPGLLKEGNVKTQVDILIDLANTVDSLQPIYQSGIPADVFYQEMAEKYPGLLKEGNVKTQVDILIDLANTVDSLQPIYENPYGMNLDEYAMDAAYDLWEMYFDIEMQKPTFADKYEKKVEQLQIENQKLKAAKNKMRQEMKERHEEQMEKAKAEANKKLAAEREKYIHQVDVLLEEKYKLRQKLETQWKAHKNSMVEAQRTELARLIAEGKKTAAEIRELKKDKKELKQRMDEVLEKEDLWVQACQAILRENNKEINRYKKQVQRLKESKEKQRERAIRKYDRLLEAKFQLQDRQKKQSERRKYAKYRRIVEQETNKMLKWITKPTDTYHVPEEMTKGLKELLTKIGTSDGEIMIMQNDLFQAIKDLERFRPKDGKEEADFFVEHDEQTIDSMNEFIGKYPNGFDLENLPADEMKELADILRSIHKRITNANKFISLFRQVEVREVSEKFLSESQKMKNTIQEGRTRQVLDFFNMDLVDPYSFFTGMGDSVRNTLFKATEEGFERKIRHEAEAEKFISGIVAKKEAAAWSTATPTLYKIGGRDIYMTPAEVMSLYATYRRNQGILHLLTGGFKTAFNKLKRMTKKEAETRLENFKPYQPSRKELEDIFNTLTDKQKEVVEKAQDFLSNVVGGWGNETSMEMFGYKKFNDQRYFPISSDKDYINNVFGDPNQKQKAIVNIGMTRPTNDQAKNPIVIEDFFTVFARQIDQMSSYNAFVPVISDWNKFMGYKKHSREEGVQEVESVKKEIVRTMGRGAISYIGKFLDDIQSVNTGEKAPITKTLVSNMKRASVGANLRVAIQQPVSIVRAADMISPKYLMMAFSKGKNDFEKIYEYAPIAQWKEWGHYDMNIARGLEERIRGQSILGKLSDYSMAMASWGDKFTWGRIWKAVEMETRDKYPDLKGERFDRKVGERFSEIINRTQVVDSMLHRSQIMREKTIYKQMTTSFMGEPIKTYNMMRNSIVALMKDNTKENRNKVVRSFVTLTFNAVAVAAAAAVVDALRDDDDDETWAEKWLEAFRGDYEKAESGGEKIMAFLSSNVGQNTNPFTYIPYLKDVFSALQGFTVQRTDIGWVNDIIKSGNVLMQYIQGESPYTFAAVLANTAASLSKATGLPIASAKRDMEAIKNTVINQAMGLEAQYENKKLTYALGSEKNVSAYVKMMIDAKLSGNDKLATRIYNEMVNAGISNEKMESQLGSKEKEKIKKDSVAMEAVEAYAKKDYDTYTQKLDELRKKYSQKNIESAIRSMYKAAYGEDDIETFDTISQEFWEKEEEVESSQFKTVIDAMMEAKLSGKLGEATKLYNYMVNNGLPNDKLDSAIDSREKELLKNDPLIKEGVEAFHEGDADRYVDIVEQLKNKNYYARNVTSAIESMHDKLYGEDDEDTFETITYVDIVEQLKNKNYYARNVTSAIESMHDKLYGEDDEDTFETITQDFWEEDEADEMVSYELLFNAFWNGSRGIYNEVWGLLNAAGKEDKNIRASMRKQCYYAYWKAEGEGNTEEMNKAAAEYQRNGGKLETLLKPPKE